MYTGVYIWDPGSINLSKDPASHDVRTSLRKIFSTKESLESEGYVLGFSDACTSTPQTRGLIDVFDPPLKH